MEIIIDLGPSKQSEGVSGAMEERRPTCTGSLHMGHFRVYTISDVLARFHRMKGFNVLHPMGWDAFGLPAENAAIERGIDASTWTARNILKMKDQLIGMGVEFDWDMEFMTCSPSFYKHTQRLFLMLLRRGLAYRADALVNWDPVDKTVLANEQVDSDGRSWRSGAVVERIQLKQWFFRITKYQDALLHDLDALESQKQWPERVLTQQRNWLGRSTGAKIKFQIRGGCSPVEIVEVYTTRPDTIFGVKYLALSTSHTLVRNLVHGLPSLQDFLHRAVKLSPDSREGYLLPGLMATNPLNHIMPNGNYDKHVPIYVSPYVLSGYGEGAVMGVPAHSSTDLAFWRQQGFIGPVFPVISPSGTLSHSRTGALTGELSTPFLSPGVLNEQCGTYSGLKSAEGGTLIVEDLGRHGGRASFAENWRLRDWLISRQRFWGTPIPIIHCATCGSVPVPEHQLPVELPVLDGSIKGKTGNPLESAISWFNTTCPKCQQPAKRETDTMDTFVDSSWYYLRFPDVGNDEQLVSHEAAASFVPIDIYVGGVEHAILHLLYARFVYKFLVAEGVLPKLVSSPGIPPEPFRRLISQGMVHGKTFSDPATGRFLQSSEVDGADTPNPIIEESGATPLVTFEKMSKSKHNGVDPSTCITKYGKDATRAHMLFSAPVSEVLEWDEEKIVGIQRWMGRISKLVRFCCSMDSIAAISDHKILGMLAHAEESPISAGQVETRLPIEVRDSDNLEMLLFVTKTIGSVEDTFSRNVYALNTAVSDLIKLTNRILADLSSSGPELTFWSTSVLLRMLAPIAPTFAQESWQTLQTNPTISTTCKSCWSGSGDSIFHAPFPKPPLTSGMAALLSQQRPAIHCAVQINGKLRFNALIPAAAIRLGQTEDIKVETNDPPATHNQQQEQEEEKEQLVDQILQTNTGRFWLTQKNDWAERKRVIIVKKADGSRLVNFVFSEAGKGDENGVNPKCT